MARAIAMRSLLQQSLKALSQAWPYALASVFFNGVLQQIAGTSVDISLICFASIFAIIGSLLVQILYTRAAFFVFDSKKFTFAKLARSIAAPFWRTIGFGLLVGVALAIPISIFVVAFVAAAYQLSENTFLICAGIALLAAIPLLYYLNALSIFSYSAIVYKNKSIRDAFDEARQLIRKHSRDIIKVFALVNLPYMVILLAPSLRMSRGVNPWLIVGAIFGVFLQLVWLALYHRLAKVKK
jgi:hypothetical protein